MSYIQPESSAKLARGALVFVRDMMCVKSGESVLITADTNSDRRAIEAVQNAADSLGAKVASVVLATPLPFQGGLADPYLADHVVAAIQHCDAWIDLCMPYIAGSKAYDDTMQNGRTRYFLGADIGAEGILRIFGGADLDKVFAVSDCFNDLLAHSAGKACRITSQAGTDVRFLLAEPEGLDIARASKPGGYFAPGTVMIIPDLETVKGDIVCEATFHEYYTPLQEPLHFKVDGVITAVSGGDTERPVIDRALRRAGNGSYGNIVHFTCGYHPAARFTGRSFIEDQRVVGCNAVGLGLPQWVPGGGENHPDCVMKGQSLWIDGEQIMADGVFKGPDALCGFVDDLQPLYG